MTIGVTIQKVRSGTSDGPASFWKPVFQEVGFEHPSL